MNEELQPLEVRKKVSDFFETHKHHWFNLLPDSPQDGQSERLMIGRITESIEKMLHLSLQFKEGSSLKTFFDRRIKVLKDEIQARKADLNKSSEIVSKRGSDFSNELTQAEQGLGYTSALNLTEIEFWEWYLTERFKMNEESTTEISENIAAHPNTKKEFAKTLRITWHYWYLHWKNHDTPIQSATTEKQGLREIAKNHNVSGQNVINRWYQISRRDFRHAKKNIKHLEHVISTLSDYPDALEFAEDDLKIAKGKISK